MSKMLRSVLVLFLFLVAVFALWRFVLPHFASSDLPIPEVADVIPAESDLQKISVSSYKSEEIVPVKEGEKCGKDVGICTAGTLCLPEASGSVVRVCKQAILDETKVCSPTNLAEVCAERDGETTTYLNECFALKYGAKIVSQGRCSVK